MFEEGRWEGDLYLWSSVAQGVGGVGGAGGAGVGPGGQAQQLPLLLLVEPAKVDRLQIAVHHSVDVQAVHCTQDVVQGGHLHHVRLY